MSTNQNPIPQGKYVPATRGGRVIFTAGMTPRNHGVLIFSGKVKAEEPLETYRDAVRQAAANCLTAARNTLAEGEQIQKLLYMTVYINGEAGFSSHAKLADFASEYLVEELGEAGIGSRAAIGIASLPGEAPVEVQMVLMASEPQ
ncbi:MAG: RidA family protein [Lawsonibacter sp.]|jgi:enamine deaminase RidA (YjgF/YER057c/UK114 family)